MAGTNIPAAADGVVMHKGWINGYGNVVVLEHQIRGDTVHTLYAHMNVASPLAVGTRVTAGASVGTVGMTGGVSTGNHLHFEVMPGGRPGSPNLRAGHSTVDPATFDFAEGEAEAADADASPQGQGPWSYPSPAREGQRAVDANTYLGEIGGQEGTLARTGDGYYPIGANSLWHGGIHFGGGSPGSREQDRGVRCIREGEVVAYRVDREYPQIEFPTGDRAAYSRSFTLIRHRLEIPAEEPAERATLVFHSLYMHQLDWKGYSDEPTRARPEHWSSPDRFRVGARARDRQDPPVNPVGAVAGEFEGECGWDDDEGTTC